jgi:hypothetical protein
MLVCPGILLGGWFGLVIIDTTCKIRLKKLPTNLVMLYVMTVKIKDMG